MGEMILEMRKISKSFPGVQALKEVDFTCDAGEIHALAGENGAGKSTLIKILCGEYHQDEGTLFVNNKELTASSPKEAQKSGISIVYQEINLIPELNVAENIFLGHEPQKKGGFIDVPLLYERVKELLAELEVNIDPFAKAENLSIAEQQIVEVAKALSLKADIIIMDEPSAALSKNELKSLFCIIQSLKDSGKTIIYISHRLEEIFQITDRITVLKDGQLVGTVRTRDVDQPILIEMMIGRKLVDTYPPKKQEKREEVLTLRNVCQGKLLKNISLSIYSGEILGISGLVGSGRTALARAIFGAAPIDGGEIRFNGRKIKIDCPKTAIAKGIGYVTEDRKKEGLVNCLPVQHNLTFTILKRLQRWWCIHSEKEKDISNRNIKDFSIAAQSIHGEVQFLSGGNQQKVILARCTNALPKLIIMDEPTRGVDVGAKAEIYHLMRHLVQQGTAIVMISSELPEIIGMSDRILVMHGGQITGELSALEATESCIMTMATCVIKETENDEERIET